MTLSEFLVVSIIVGIVAFGWYFLRLDDKANQKERDEWNVRWNKAETDFYAYIGQAQVDGKRILEVAYHTYLIDGVRVSMEDFLEEVK